MKHFNRLCVLLALGLTIFTLLCAVPSPFAPEGDVAFVSFGQPNKIAETRLVEADGLAPDKYGIWPTLDFTVAEPLHSKEAKKLDFIYDIKSILSGGFSKAFDADALLVLYKGELVYEYYANGYDLNTPHDMYSVTKSILQACVGLAINEGYLSGVTQKVSDFFPKIEASEQDTAYFGELTIEHLLTMTSGLLEGWDDEAMPKILDDGTAVLKFVSKPGTKFRYNNTACNFLAELMTRALGEPVQNYAQKKLFEPLGMTSVEWKANGEFPSPGTSSITAPGGYGLRMTPRDMLRFGYLYLNNGRWEEKQLLPVEWVLQSPPKSEALAGYGRLWWNNYLKPYTDYYEAVGMYGQFISISPSRDLVIVRTTPSS